MTTLEPTRSVLIGCAVTVATLVYVLPAFVALARDTTARTQVVILNIAAGWTLAGWICALVLAFGPRTPKPPGPPPTRPLPRPPCPHGIYRDGVYIASSGADTNTWVIREDGYWRIVYEVGGEERLVGAVTEADVPLSVLATALERAEAGR
jgi:hypothetical protein